MEIYLLELEVYIKIYNIIRKTFTSVQFSNYIVANLSDFNR